MSTFKDLLVWYNDLDAVPFLEVVEKMMSVLASKKIDMFKDGIKVFICVTVAANVLQSLWSS